MKFLILALCLYAASAAQIGLRNNWQQQQQFLQPTAQAIASASVSPSSVTVTPFARNYQSNTPAVAKAYSSVSSTATPVAKAYSSVVQPAVQQVVEKVAQPVVQAYNAVQAAPVVAKSVVRSSGDADAPIVRSVVDVTADGFNYAYESGNGIAAEEHGVLRRVNDVDSIAVEGSYQYQGPEGPVFVSYIADENGFQPKSDSIPTPPPVPVAILRALEWIASQPKHVETAYKKL